MPREQLRLLSEDVVRLLNAGVLALNGDDKLCQRSKALHGLAARVPALGVVTRAVDRVLTSTPSEAAPALIELLTLVQQVRSQLASAGPGGDLQPVENSGPWQTATPTKEVTSDAEAWVQMIPRGSLPCDLRLVNPLLAALARGHLPISNAAADSGPAALGPAALNEVKALVLAGDDKEKAVREADRLRMLVCLDPAAALEAIRRADPELAEYLEQDHSSNNATLAVNP